MNDFRLSLYFMIFWRELFSRYTKIGNFGMLSLNHTEWYESLVVCFHTKVHYELNSFR